jgi:two-component system LytT family response regulator
MGAFAFPPTIRVLVSEPDVVSRRSICELLERGSSMMVTCVDDSSLVSSIHKSSPDLVVVDVNAPAIRRASSWEAVGIKSAPATIVTAYDSSAVSTFVSTAIDFLVKPFDPERFEAAVDLAKSEIARERAKGEIRSVLKREAGRPPQNPLVREPSRGIRSQNAPGSSSNLANSCYLILWFRN